MIFRKLLLIFRLQTACSWCFHIHGPPFCQSHPVQQFSLECDFYIGLLMPALFNAWISSQVFCVDADHWGSAEVERRPQGARRLPSPSPCPPYQSSPEHNQAREGCRWVWKKRNCPQLQFLSLKVFNCDVLSVIPNESLCKWLYSWASCGDIV